MKNKILALIVIGLIIIGLTFCLIGCKVINKTQKKQYLFPLKMDIELMLSEWH